MSDTYTRVNWEDSPSTNTPISAENLNKMDKGIEDAHKKCTEISETISDLSFELVIMEVNNGIGKLAIVRTSETPTEGVTQVGNKLIIVSGVTATQNGSTLAIA